MPDTQLTEQSEEQNTRTLIKELRDLRSIAKSLNDTAYDDLKPFTQDNGLTFRRRVTASNFL
jgi:hypothetical protein